jgi:hypothetical protein
MVCVWSEFHNNEIKVDYKKNNPIPYIPHINFEIKNTLTKHGILHNHLNLRQKVSQNCWNFA